MARLRSEEGWALATAMIVLMFIMSLGLAAFAYVDAQQRLSQVERERESAFNLGEAALTAQVFVVGKAWPNVAAEAYATCSSSSAVSAQCPNPARLVGSTGTFTGADYAAGASWTTDVRDDQGAGATTYDDAQARWDANGNGQMWI